MAEVKEVFISYHEKSAGELVRKLADRLEGAGMSCWYASRDLPTGGDFADYIPPQIYGCKVFLLILNEGANQSRHVESEVGLAFRRYNKGEKIDILPYQVEKSMATLKSAGWFGKGPGEGVVKYELPDAHTDFIMAVSAEEFGFLITAFVILIFAYLVWRVTQLIRRENNLFSQIATGGLLAQITFQSLVNISSTLNLIPTKGMTLPFISYGGSSLVSVAFAFGLILALTHGHTFSRGLE